MHFTLIPLSWHKRRRPSAEPTVISFEIFEFELNHNHKCRVIAEYDNGLKIELLGRVLHNPRKQHWTINALNASGYVLDFAVHLDDD